MFRTQFNAEIKDSTISDIVGYASTSSTFQICQEHEGKEKAADKLSQLQKEYVIIPDKIIFNFYG